MSEQAGLYLDRVVVVTGASRGIGKFVGQHFLDQGAWVVGFARSQGSLEHSRYCHFCLDVGDAKKVQRAFQAVYKRFSRLDIVINNAAVLTSQYSMILPAGEAQAMVTTNLLGTFFVSREAAKWMKRRKFGRIINIGSMAAALEPVGDSVYAACKAAVSTLANVMAKELSSYNITCNTVAISAIESDMLRQLPADKVAAVVAGLTIPRFASAEDIINVIDFFSSERSSYITAQQIFLGGVH